VTFENERQRDVARVLLDAAARGARRLEREQAAAATSMRARTLAAARTRCVWCGYAAAPGSVACRCHDDVERIHGELYD
jgi:hypothetical protein